MKLWVFLCLVCAMHVSSGFKIEDYLSPTKQLPDDITPEALNRLRGLQLIKTCQKFGDPHRIEHLNVSQYLDYPSYGQVPLGSLERAFFNTRPKLAGCASRLTGHDQLKAFEQAALEVYPVKVDKKDNAKRTEKQKKEKKKKSKVLSGK